LTIKSTSHTTLVHATFFALTYLCFVMPVNIQLSKIFDCAGNRWGPGMPGPYGRPIGGPG